jgi:hypothetical protein
VPGDRVDSSGLRISHGVDPAAATGGPPVATHDPCRSRAVVLRKPEGGGHWQCTGTGLHLASELSNRRGQLSKGSTCALGLALSTSTGPSKQQHARAKLLVVRRCRV